MEQRQVGKPGRRKGLGFFKEMKSVWLEGGGKWKGEVGKDQVVQDGKDHTEELVADQKCSPWGGW